MQKICAYEYKDLDEDVKDGVEQDALCEIVEDSLLFLSIDLEKENITEEEYYKELGCSKYYAETTSWFIPARYYEKHKEEIDKEVEIRVNSMLYTKYGVVIGHKEEEK